MTNTSESSNSVHVVVGAGAMGSGVALRLAESGDRVRVVTRSGSGPTHPNIERVAADASNGARLAEIAAGAVTVFNCANPPYSTWVTDWPPIQAGLLHACEQTGARLVTVGNLYVYAADSSPMRPTDPLDAPSVKGGVRAQMWRDALAAHEAGRVQVTEVRASDFFGPGTGENGHLGDRFVQPLLEGKRPSVVGDPTQPHSWSFIDDVCDTLVALSRDDRAFGRAWHVPTLDARTISEMAHALCDEAGVQRRRVRQIPSFALRLIGLFSKDLAELREIQYQHVRPFVMDANETTAVFGLTPTPLVEQMQRTIAAERGASSSSPVRVVEPS